MTEQEAHDLGVCLTDTCPVCRDNVVRNQLNAGAQLMMDNSGHACVPQQPSILGIPYPYPPLEQTLQARGQIYGEFREIANITQKLKAVMHECVNWPNLTNDKKETLEMIAHKIARILAGDPEFKDNWHDIAGYAKLAEDRTSEATP